MSGILKSDLSASRPAGAMDANSTQRVTVQLGETTLEDVASRLHVDPDDLRRANPQITASKLKPGEQILLPLPASLKPGAAPPAGPAPAPSNSRPSSRQALHEAFAKAPLNLGPELEDDEKMMARLGDEALWLYRRRKAFNALPNDMDRQVAWAHDIYTKTGQIATRYPLTAAEIKEGKVMTRAERYDKFLASQGHDPAKLFRKGELDFAKRNEFLTDSEFESEHQLRLKAAEKDLADSCPSKYHSTEQIENCQAKVWDKYYGQDGSDDYRKRMANARIAGEEYSHHIDSVKSGGPISMIGRGVDRLAGGDGEFGAAAGGLLDMKGTIAVGKSEMARQERYKATGGLEVRRDTAADIRSAPPSTPGADMPVNASPQKSGAPAGNNRAPIAYQSTQAEGKPASPVKTGGSNPGRQLPPTLDSTSPSAPAQGGARPTHLQSNPISPSSRMPDSQQVTIRTPNGVVRQMTAGEYRGLYEQARQWLSTQLTEHHWGPGQQPGGPALEDLSRQAADRFGLDRNWWSVGNPIIHGDL